MSKLDTTLVTLHKKLRPDLPFHPDTADESMELGECKQSIKDLIQKLVDETFDADDKNAMIFWQKVERL